MATNPYSYGSLGSRWTVGEPTSKSLLDISRVKNDANRWTLEQLIPDPDTTQTLGFDLSFSSSSQRLLQIYNASASNYFQIFGGRAASSTSDYLVFSTGTNGTIMEFDGANHWITFHDTAGVQKMYYRGDGSPGLILESGVDLTVGGTISGTTGTFSGDLTVGTTDLVVDVTANKVGIGGTPTEELDIQGSGATQTIRLIRTDASTAGGITINSANSSNYLYNTAAKDLVLSADNGATQTKLHSNGDFSVNSYKIFLDNATSYVGIATLSPNARLDVNGDIRYEGRILPTSAASDGTAAAPSIVVGGDYDNGFFRPANNTIGFTTGGVERARIDASGNMGLGDTPNAYKNSYRALQLGSSGANISARTDADTIYVNANAYRHTDGNWKYDSTDEASQYYQTSGTHYWQRAASGTAGTNITWTTQAVLDATGLGIGTTSPTGLLNLMADGATPFAGSAAILLDLKRGVTNSSANNNTAIRLGNNSNGFQISYGGSADHLQFLDGGNIAVVTILNGGSVGIGTSSPSALIHAEAADGTEGGAIKYTATSEASAYLSASPDGAVLATDTAGIVFRTGITPNDPTDTGTERVRIDSSGNLLVGKTTTSAATAGASISYTGAATFVRDSDCLLLNRPSTTGTIAAFRQANTEVGTISVTASATAYNTSSDYRLKENIVGITDGITRIKSLKPSRFNFIAEADRTVDGFVAHEVSDIVPEAISGAKDAVDDDGNPQYQGIDQSKLVPLLTAALQEAITKIETLETKVAALEAA